MLTHTSKKYCSNAIDLLIKSVEAYITCTNINFSRSRYNKVSLLLSVNTTPLLFNDICLISHTLYTHKCRCFCCKHQSVKHHIHHHHELSMRRQTFMLHANYPHAFNRPSLHELQQEGERDPLWVFV